jgi:hypothetical protein
MLSALENLDRRRARAALLHATARVIPARFREGAAYEPPSDEVAVIAERVFEEAAKSVESKRPRDEEERRGLIRDVLSKALTEMALTGVDLAETRARMGRQGNLPVSLFRIGYSDFFETNAKVWGFRKAHVEGAIRQYDNAQHLLPRYAPLEEAMLASLFVKTPTTQGQSYTVLIDAARYGERLIVDAAFRVYHDDIDLVGTSSPLDILERFLKKYGFELEIEGHVGNPITGLLVDTTGRNGFQMKVPELNQSYFQPAIHNNTEVLLQYAFNFTAYSAMLTRHRVPHEDPPRSQGHLTTQVLPLRGRRDRTE